MEEDLPRTLALPAAPGRAYEAAHSEGWLLAPAAAPPEGAEVVVALPDGARFAYVPSVEGAPARAEVAPDPFLRGNQFKPLHQSARALAALLSIAGGRRLELGPESERVLVFLRGHGLVFLENGDTHRFEAGWVAVLPAGEPARVWAQQEDVLAVALQPAMARQERRTLAGEIARRRAPEEERSG